MQSHDEFLARAIANERLHAAGVPVCQQWVVWEQATPAPWTEPQPPRARGQGWHRLGSHLVAFLRHGPAHAVPA